MRTRDLHPRWVSKNASAFQVRYLRALPTGGSMTKLPELPYTESDPDNGLLFTHDGESAKLTFDQLVLPHLLNVEAFLAMSPAVRLRAVVDFATVHPEKHNQSVWGSVKAEVDLLLPDDTEVIEGAECLWSPENRMSRVAVLAVPKPDTTLSCGTSHCLAGWGANFGGAQFVRPFWGEDTLVELRDVIRYEEEEDSDLPAAREISLDSLITPDGKYGSVREYARWLFGLSEDTAAMLFSPSNSIYWLRDLMSNIESGVIE